MHLLFCTYSVYRETRVIYDYSVMAITSSCIAVNIPKNGKDREQYPHHIFSIPKNPLIFQLVTSGYIL